MYIENDSGVEIVIDMTLNEISDHLVSMKYDLIVCCNIVEHVRKGGVFIRNLPRLPCPGPRLVVTVPLMFPKHIKTIDTMRRSTAARLIDAIRTYTQFKVVMSEELVITEGWYSVQIPGRIHDYLPVRSSRSIVRWCFRPLRWEVASALLKLSGMRAGKQQEASLSERPQDASHL